MPTPLPPHELDRLHQEVQAVKDSQQQLADQQRDTAHAVAMLSDTLPEIRDYMRQLTAVAVKQEEDRSALARAFKKIDLLDNRLRDVRERLPMLTHTSALVQRWLERVAWIGLASGAIYYTKFLE